MSLLLCVCCLLFSVFPVQKCSVSCGTGIQVRKIECNANGHKSVGNGVDDTNDDDVAAPSAIDAEDGAGDARPMAAGIANDGTGVDFAGDNTSTGSMSNSYIANDAAADSRTGKNPTNNSNKKKTIKDIGETDAGALATTRTGASAATMQCDPNNKPADTQPCTTGIICAAEMEDDTDDGSDEHYDNEHISSEEVHELLNSYRDIDKQAGWRKKPSPLPSNNLISFDSLYVCIFRFRFVLFFLLVRSFGLSQLVCFSLDRHSWVQMHCVAATAQLYTLILQFFCYIIACFWMHSGAAESFVIIFIAAAFRALVWLFDSNWFMILICFQMPDQYQYVGEISRSFVGSWLSIPLCIISIFVDLFSTLSCMIWI